MGSTFFNLAHPYNQWRQNLKRLYNHSIGSGHIYQFGVAAGKTFRQTLSLHHTKAWGFDSFQGLPDENTTQEAAVGWVKGFKSDDPRKSQMTHATVEWVEGCTVGPVYDPYTGTVARMGPYGPYGPVWGP